MKNKILKGFICFVLAILFCLTSNVQAKDLKFKAAIGKQADNPSSKTVTFRFYTKKHGSGHKTTNWTWYGQSNRGGKYSYGSYAISFWGESNSARYSTSSKNGGYKSAFDKDNDGDFFTATSSDPKDDLPELKLIKKDNGKIKYYWVRSPKDKTSADFTLKITNYNKTLKKAPYRKDGKKVLNEMKKFLDANTSFYRKRTKTIYRTSTYATAVVDYTLTQKGIDKVLNKYYDNGNITKYMSGKYLRVKFSVGTHTYWNGSTSGPWDSVWMSTAYKARKAVNTMNTKNYAVDTSGTSIINHFDNWLYLPVGDLVTNRTVTVKYRVKNDEGKWYTAKTEEDTIGIDSETIKKTSIGSDLDKYYIGGKIAQGDTEDKAKDNLETTTKKWGWDTTSVTIPKLEKEQHYIIYFYYDYRTVNEKHLNLDETVIKKSYNKSYKLLTKTSKVLYAKDTYNATTKKYTKTNDKFYYNKKKYVYAKTKVGSKEYTDKRKYTSPGKDGAEKLVFGSTTNVKFLYDIEPARYVYARHFVYDPETKKVTRATNLTNANAAIKDGEDGKYYLRPNGYSQRRLKSGVSDITAPLSSDFNEKYIIDFSDTIKLEKSRVIEDDGTKYVYYGYKTKNDAKPAKSTTLSSIKAISKKAARVTFNPKRVQKTYIDFYYVKEPINPPGDPGTPDDPGGDEPDTPEPDSPTLDFIPQDDSGTQIAIGSAGSDSKCSVVNVPSGENLKAFITTTTYRPYSLIYDGETINQSTGKISYKLKKYEVYKYVDGAIKNNADSKYGYINSTDRYGVFDTNSDVAVKPNATTINNLVKESRTNYSKSDIDPTKITTIEDGQKTDKSFYGNENVHKVKYDKYNGIRNPNGVANYNITTLVEDGTNVFKVKETKKPVKTQNNAQVNVSTPARISFDVSTVELVNHSNKEGFVIQKNSEFRVTPKAEVSTVYTKTRLNTEKYIKYYWLALDFDVKLLQNETVYDKATKTATQMGKDSLVKAGKLIKIPVGGSFKGIATNESEEGDIVNQFSNKIKIVAVTYNLTDADWEFEKKIMETIGTASGGASTYIDETEITRTKPSCEAESTKQTHKNITGIGATSINTMYEDTKYYVQHMETSKNIGRIYDFRVTDCLDVNFKNVFRLMNNTDVNELSGIKYFSGVRRLLVYGGNGVQLGANASNTNNIFDDRANTDSSINSTASKTILPLGPYKHTDQNYIQAPKLGYRVSFDLKTSGVYKKNTDPNAPVRSIKITPSYYYISKDGKTFNNNIDLYYKNSSGKYSKFVGSGYAIYFKPNDGYRFKYNISDTENYKDMSTKMESLKIGDESFTLTDSMMSYSDNNFVQAWYGEFKLPNSTIAVKKGENIKNQLTDGYIGVIFKIECIDKESKNATDSIIVAYDNQDKAYSGTPSNTTQWDYEGYLGFAKSNIGTNLNGELRIQLEKDFWRITDQTLYNNIKGTVVLYDLDNRAANDFE